MSSFADDLRFSIRSLRGSPVFTATAASVLALGIALNVAIFAVVNALLFKPLGGRAEGELAGVYDRDRERPDDYRRFSYPAYRAIREHAGVLSSVLAQEAVSVGLTEGHSSRRAYAALVSTNYFSTLATRPALGRDFRTEEEGVAGARVAIVSDSYWRRHGATPQLVGTTIRVNGRDVTIVGVAPSGFSGATALFSPDLWLPLGACAFVSAGSEGGEATACLDNAERAALALVGRLRPAATRAAATASLAGLSRGLERPKNAPHGTREIVVGPLSRLSIGASPRGDSEVALVLLFLSGLAACVLFIASLNLAHMLLARGAARHREVAVRLALGSSRWGVARLLMMEPAVIAACGAVLGLALAAAGTRVLAVALAGALPFPLAFDALPDARVVAAALAFALTAGVACGVGPAIGLTRRADPARLREHGTSSSGGAGRMSLRNVLVVLQLATSLALLTSAGLFLRGAAAAADANPGFSLEGGVVAAVSPELSAYPEARGRQAYETALARLRAQPGITSASMASAVPFGMESDAGMVRDAARGEKATATVALLATVGTDYFRTLDLPLLRGREFTAAEERAPGGARSVIVDRSLAARLWPGADALGQRLQLEGDGGWGDAMTVVGVVPAVRQSLFDTEAPAHVYLPAGSDYKGQMFLHARLAARASEAAAPQVIREALRRADPGLAVLNVDTLRGHRDRSVYTLIARAGAGLFSVFGVSALVLAVLGVYGVKSYLVSRRGKEIAIRTALGATRGDILRLVLRDGAVLTGVGLACGLAASAALTKLLASWVYGAGTLNLVPLSGACALLGSSALLACYLPVRRATRQAVWAGLRAE